MRLTEIFDLIFEAGRRQGFNKGDIARRAGIEPASLSRMLKTGNARYDMIERLADVVNMELTVIPSNKIARGLASGNLFDL